MMLRNMIRLTAMAAFVLAICFSVSAQKRDVATGSTANKFLISAEAGGVNHVEGAVRTARMGGTGGLLLKGDSVDIGDRISTGADGRAEILLNPGSYLRLGANSSFEFKTTSLDDLQVKLASGSAMFEVYAANEFKVSIFTPKGKSVLVETGVYRVDLARDGTGVVSVIKGKAEVGASTVKKGRTATIGADVVAVAKFDTGERDEFAEWSRSRGKELAKMTSSLNRSTLRDSLISSFYGGRWNLRGSFGLWIFDPFSARHCFLPFGYGWNSPYGHGYGAGIYGYSLPRPIYFPPTSIGPPPTPTGGGTATSKNPHRQPRVDPSDGGGSKFNPEPPYVRMGGKRETPSVFRDDFGRFPPVDRSTGREQVFDSPSRQSSPSPVSGPAPISVQKDIGRDTGPGKPIKP